jgi:hypothetical protein
VRAVTIEKIHHHTTPPADGNKPVLRAANFYPLG